jgi:DNA repair exonuclease SbcCD nuclease subunit
MSKVFVWSDTHLGARSNNNEWVDIIESAHYDFIIPTIEKNWKKGDIIIHCGDVFDNRQSINLKVLHLGIKIYERLAKLGEIHIIAGNHDIYKKDSTEITSLDALKWIPNIHIWKTPGCIERGDKKLFLMPWRTNTKEESETLIDFQKQFKPDYAFMHGTFSNTQYNKYVKIGNEDGGSTKSTAGYKRVYSGHIHWAQHINNINIIGSPYEITRGDSDNTKGMYCLDLESGEETFYENTVSPKHLKFKMEEFDKEVFKKIEEVAPNNFIDVIVANSALSSHAPKFKKALDKLKCIARNLEVQQYEDSILDEDEEVNENANLDHEELIQNEIEKRLPEESRKRAIKIIDDIIKEVS